MKNIICIILIILIIISFNKYENLFINNMPCIIIPYKSSKLYMLQNNWQIIKEEVSQLKTNMIRKEVRFQDEWGETLKDLVKLHEQKSGWVYSTTHSLENRNKDITLATDKEKYSSEWLTFMLIYNGRQVGKNNIICPQTSLLLSHIPNILGCGFSLMRPGCVIERHTHYNTSSSRDSTVFHIGLDVPDACFFTIEKDGKIVTVQEKDGKMFGINPKYPHWAVNFSDRNRIILYVEIENNF